jgi:hypothetical protein
MGDLVKEGKEKEKEKFGIIAEALEGLYFGELQITVHEGKIVQINRIEKQRFSV